MMVTTKAYSVEQFGAENCSNNAHEAAFVTEVQESPTLLVMCHVHYIIWRKPATV